jgi:hypothetical protein
VLKSLLALKLKTKQRQYVHYCVRIFSKVSLAASVVLPEQKRVKNSFRFSDNFIQEFKARTNFAQKEETAISISLVKE